jgi:DNA-binding transcriptional ArsR family regulator
MQEILKMQAEIYKSFSSPSRLQIIELLSAEELNATDIIKETGLSKANLSQHMAVLVQNGLVKTRKQGTSVFYSISNKKIYNACSLIQEMAMDTIKKKNDIIDRAM